MPDNDRIKSSLPDIKKLISEYPRLAFPVGVFIALLGLATIAKTLIEGFTWAYDAGGIRGFMTALGGSIVVLVIFITVVNRVLRPRPEIEILPSPYLSKYPTIKWTYDEPKKKRVTYQVAVKDRETGKENKRINGPQKMYHAVLNDCYGDLYITVNAMINNKPYRASRKYPVKIYEDAVHRIQLTGKIKVAVHQDPGEEIFCYYYDDKWQGFDIDFVNLIAKELESALALKNPVEVEYLFYPWPQVIGAPNAYEVDFAIASISISAERARKYNVMFSEPYSESQQGIIANSGSFDENINCPIPLDKLKGKTIAFHKETTASRMVERIKQDPGYRDSINFKVAENNDELRAFLKNGTVDGVINDYQRAFSLYDRGMVVEKLVHDIDIEPDLYGLAFARISSRLRKNINKIINQKKDKIARLLDERIEHMKEKNRREEENEVLY